MYIAGKRLNADGSAMIRAPRGTKYTDVTLNITNCDWYQFDVSAADPHIVRMTWSRHPLLGQAADIQKLFDDGAMLLAKDDDALIRDDDPTVTGGNPQFDGALYESDDVPIYVEFIAPSAWNSEFPAKFADDRYNHIVSLDDARALLADSCANIKQVASMKFPNGDNTFSSPAGVGWFLNPSILIIRDASPACAVHEWGHTVGLPDNTNDTDRVMYQYELIGTHNTIDREERGSIVWSIWSGTPWGW
jgi:hypothetical protein